jgi:predicted cupin superfamily sugar epimerase
MLTTKTAEDIIAHLGLKPHPEGGYFRETFRDEGAHKARAHSTAILYLLRAGEMSRWHRVDAAELWHWYGRRAAPARSEAWGNAARIPARGGLA